MGNRQGQSELSPERNRKGQSMDKEKNKPIASSDELNDYMRVTSPAVWMVLLAVAVFVAGLIVWSLMGTLTSSVAGVAVVKNQVLSCYVRDDDADAISPGMWIEIGEDASGRA